jgi:putative DNA methylase
MKDLRVFLLLMGMDDTTFKRRIKGVSPKDIDPSWPAYMRLVESDPKPSWRKDVTKDERNRLVSEWILALPYDRRLDFCFRPEECSESELLQGIWEEVNAHLGTSANSLSELVDQLGIMRFGHRPRVADTFAGSGSIPFEAARLGCEAYASDLNPIACMLTWGAFHIVGASREDRTTIEQAQREVVTAVEAEIARLGIEHDSEGNRAKAFLYCLETTCPKTGWAVPMLGTLVISKGRNAIATLVPDHKNKRYDVEIVSGVSAEELRAAEKGTVQNGRLVHPLNPERDGVAISVIRGDYKEDGKIGRNKLREWEKSDFAPLPTDIFRERLYCVQWITSDTISKGRQETFFAGVRDEDLAREKKVAQIVAENLSSWQQQGLVPDMRIEPGEETSRLLRERGWTHWHHFFTPRQLLLFQITRAACERVNGIGHNAVLIGFTKALDWGNRGCRFGTGAARESISNLFSNQALNTLVNYGVRSTFGMMDHIRLDFGAPLPKPLAGTVACHAADEVSSPADIFITDPPYADAVNYHEITEFFIAWLRNQPPSPWKAWTWDSRRERAVKGTDEKFRSDMVAAYRAMATNIPECGMQVVMFTHQDAGIWADLAAIMWAAGLRVTAAWNIVTEKESALKEGNYVQGTILLVLRKRQAEDNIKRMDIEGEIEAEVDRQLAVLHDLDEDWTSERLYTDGDLQLAAYAAALRVITKYATIDRREVGADVYRKVTKGEKSVIRELIEYAASVANNKLVPEGFPPTMWRDLDPASRFYVRMLDMETKGTTRFADYQDFARTFSFADYTDLMDSTKANAASLAGAMALKGKTLGANGFGSSPLRRVLFAIYKTMQKDDPREGLTFLKTEYGPEYWQVRSKLIELAKYVSTKTSRTRPTESSAADLMAQRLEVDRI